MNTPPPRVTVHWLDIYVVTHGWTDLSDAKGEPCPCETTGYLIERTDDRLTVAATWGAFDAIQVNGLTVIPAGCVTKIENLTGGEAE